MSTFTFIDTPRLIPVDVVAEESLAGKAIVAGTDARDIVSLVGPDQFHDPRCWHIIEAAAGPLMDDVTDDGIDWADPDADVAMLAQGCAQRVVAIGIATGIELSWLRHLITHRSGEQVERLVDRLFDVDEKRQLIRAHLDALIDCGVDVRMLTNFDAWMDASRRYVLQAGRAVGDAFFRGGSDADMAAALRDVGALFGLSEADIIDAVTGGEP